jgi:rubrerythrin
MKLENPLALRRARAIWADPRRALLTLESFASTEEDGGRDLLAAISRVQDPRLLEHMHRHADDEVRHARLFRDRAAEVAASQGTHLGQKNEEMGRAFDLRETRGGDELDAHGFLQAGLIDDLGVVGYVCMLHVAEQRAAEFFALHRDASRAAGDERTSAIFESILRDEKYHVSWTGTALERWRKEGRGAEVERGLGDARRGRLLGAWRALGLRSASGFQHVLLMALYWSVLAPFGLVARGSGRSGGWRMARPTTLESQY